MKRAWCAYAASGIAASQRLMALRTAGVGVILLLLMFLLGKRSGKKKSAVIEIRRV